MRVLELLYSMLVSHCLAIVAFDPVRHFPTSWGERALLLVAYPLLHCRPLINSFPKQYSINNFRSHGPFAPDSIEYVELILYWQ